MWIARPHYIEDKESKEYASHRMRDLTELAIYPNEGFTLTLFINSLLDGFKWGTAEAAAFDALKQQLFHVPILGLPNFDDTFVVEADVSSKGVPNQVADALSRMYEEDEGITVSFMAMIRPLVGLVNDLKNENETMEELRQLHGKLDREERLDGFRREQGLMLYQDRYYVGTESKLKILLLSEF
ncbi:ty3-gypsy retrotransposon protein, partial [Tanacetum coccineum]